MARPAAPFLALILILAFAATVFADTQKVSDPRHDGHRGCEIYAATAGHAKGARLKHTVTVADRISSRALAPIVPIFARKKRSGWCPADDAVPGSSGVR